MARVTTRLAVIFVKISTKFWNGIDCDDWYGKFAEEIPAHVDIPFYGIKKLLLVCCECRPKKKKKVKQKHAAESAGRILETWGCGELTWSCSWALNVLYKALTLIFKSSQTFRFRFGSFTVLSRNLIVQQINLLKMFKLVSCSTNSRRR